MRVRRGALSASQVAMVAAVVLGCTSAPRDAAPPTEWEAPAWFAEQARDLEELRTGLQSCMDDHGWTLTVDDFGGIVEALPADQQDQIDADFADCYSASGFDVAASPPLTRDDYDGWYAANIDTRECLVARGYDMAEPPSKDAWVDAMVAASAQSATSTVDGGAGPWSPYSDPALDSIAETELASIQKDCPTWLKLPVKASS